MIGRRPAWVDRWAVALFVPFLAIALTLIFWPKLWRGGGLLGGDVYAYNFPQKILYAQALREGTLPFWNHLVGNGYPQLAESQTGALYPLNLVLYRSFDLNTAYNSSVLIHYVWAFLGCWLVARRWGLTPTAAGLAAIVYTYGWFPPRISLEWPIVGGAWLPWAVWCVESYLQQYRKKWLICLACALTMQLLAGHFLIAFLTQLMLAIYTPIRIVAGDTSARCHSWWKVAGCLVLAVVWSYLLAAAQLVPTWELKQVSQRARVNSEHDPAFGAVPPRYLTQVFAPWNWYPDRQSFLELFPAEARSRVNRIDSHLYFGMMPLALSVIGLWDVVRKRDGRWLAWLAPGTFALLYMPGWLMPVTKHLPGFSFFEGPGRFGVLATLVAALLAAWGFQAIRKWLIPPLQPLWVVFVMALTIFDLVWVADLVHDAEAIDDPPINHLAESSVKIEVIEPPRPEPVRFWSDGYNVPTLIGAGTFPVYLGLGPSPYFDPRTAISHPYPFLEVPPSPEQIAWLRRNGVTHILSSLPLDLEAWPARLVWDWSDLCLNPMLNIGASQKVFIYELEGSRRRAAWLDAEMDPPPRIISYQPCRVEISCQSAQGGVLVLTDLNYPGWHLFIDGQPAEGIVIEDVFRGARIPPGEHSIVWTFRSNSFYWGTTISISSLILLIAYSVFPLRRRRESLIQTADR